MRREKDDAATVRDRDAGRDVIAEKQLLHRNGVRPKLRKQRFKIVPDLHEPLGKRKLLGRRDRAVLQHPLPGSVRFDQPEADGGYAGIDAKDPHAPHPPR